jgi:hypothetical protein
MLTNSYHFIEPVSDAERVYLESLIRADYALCHPDETLDDLKHRARFAKEDKGMYRDWLAVAARRAEEAAAAAAPRLMAAE